MLDQPFVRPSVIQNIDPRARMAVAGLTALCLSLLQNVAASLAGLGLGLCLLALARPPLRPLLHRLAIVNIFALFLWCVTPLTMPGQEVARWGIVSLSAEGLHLALLVTIKSNAIVCVFLALIATMNTPTAGHALECLHCPRKLVSLFLFTARHVYDIAQQWESLSVAARLRGFRPRTNVHTYRTVASLLGLLLVRSYERSQRVREAMLLRGFSGQFRTVAVFKARPADALFVLLMLLCLVGLIVMEHRDKIYGL